MMPVSAILTVFTLVFAAIVWIRLLSVCFDDSTFAGFIALFIPPLALMLLMPRWRQEKDLYQLLGLALVCLLLSLTLH